MDEHLLYREAKVADFAGESEEDLFIIEQYLMEINSCPQLSEEEEKTLLKQMKSGDNIAREKLIQANLRVVVNTALEFKGKGIPALDLIQDGSIGLMEAIASYEENGRDSLANYAYEQIVKALKEEVDEEETESRLPNEVEKTIELVNKAERELTEELGREASLSEIALHIGIEEEKVTAAKSLYRDAMEAIEEATDSDKEEELLKEMEESQMNDAEIAIAKVEESERVQELFSGLDEEEELIVRKSFGFDGSKMSGAEIAKEMNMEEGEVTEVLNRAMMKLKNAKK